MVAMGGMRGEDPQRLGAQAPAATKASGELAHAVGVTVQDLAAQYKDDPRIAIVDAIYGLSHGAGGTWEIVAHDDRAVIIGATLYGRDLSIVVAYTE